MHIFSVQISFVVFLNNIAIFIIHGIPLIQDEQLSVTGERMCLGGLPRNSVARLTDRAQNDLKCVEGP